MLPQPVLAERTHLDLGGRPYLYRSSHGSRSSMYVTGGYATRLASCAFTFGSAILPLLTPVSYRAVFARFPSFGFAT